MSQETGPGGEVAEPDLIELACERVGGLAIVASDEFFAPKENLLKPSAAIFLEEEFVPTGKWMDGWETRRRREPGHDWVILRLGIPGVIRRIDVDTSHFRGNYPEACSVEWASAPIHARPEQLLAAEWRELLPRSPLQGHHHNLFEVDSPRRVTHLRLNIFPDGGVARLRVHGEPVPDWMRPQPVRMAVDLAARANGASVVSCSDMFFGNRNHLIQPGPSIRMDDGWETRRRRQPGNDWAVVALASSGVIHTAVLDTTHFKGNCPAAASLEGRRGEEGEWLELLPRVPLVPHTEHVFQDELRALEGLTHVRVQIYPCGGLARLRLWATPDRAGLEAARLRWLHGLTPEACEASLLALCGSREWARRAAEARPFRSAEEAGGRLQELWRSLGPEDWLEAFAAHPAIGSRKAEAAPREAAWSRQEQAAASVAPEAVLEELKAANLEYQERFGFVFLICATGRSAGEILEALKGRLGNTRAQELQNAAKEQARILQLRWEKWLHA